MTSICWHHIALFTFQANESKPCGVSACGNKDVRNGRPNPRLPSPKSHLNDKSSRLEYRVNEVSNYVGMLHYENRGAAKWMSRGLLAVLNRTGSGML